MALRATHGDECQGATFETAVVLLSRDRKGAVVLRPVAQAFVPAALTFVLTSGFVSGPRPQGRRLLRQFLCHKPLVACRGACVAARQSAR